MRGIETIKVVLGFLAVIGVIVGICVAASTRWKDVDNE